MGELRDALDEGERQARELEREKGTLRKGLEETQGRLEKLQKSSKVSAFGSCYAVWNDGLMHVVDNGRRPSRAAGQNSKSRIQRPVLAVLCRLFPLT